MLWLASTISGFAAEDVLARHYRGEGPYEVELANLDWKDARRDRDVPARIYSPKTGRGPYPLIIFSHGLGGNRTHYEYLGRHWASHGYIDVHVEHNGSDTDAFIKSKAPVWSVIRSVSPRMAIYRPLDIAFAIDRMADLSREDGPFKGRVDLERVGVSGHSYGAFTTLAIAGQVFLAADGTTGTLADPRVKAGIPMSSPVINWREQFDAAYGPIAIPLLHLTGTQDILPIGRTAPEARRIPFDHIRGADQYLVTFRGADHLTFVGFVRPGPVGRFDKRFHDLTGMVTLAFWEAYLRDDSEAKKLLRDKGFENALGADGKFEKKSPDPPLRVGAR